MMPQLGLLALAAAGAGAIMIPPNVVLNTEGQGDFKIAVIPEQRPRVPVQTYGVDPYTQVIGVPCQSCPFAEFSDNGVTWTNGRPNYLYLNISVGSDPKTLELNGVPFFPPEKAPAGEPASLPKVPQISQDISLDQVKAHPELKSARNLDLYAYSVMAESAHSSSESGEEVVKMFLRLHPVESEAIKIPEIIITTVVTKARELLIIKTEVSNKSEADQCQRWPMVCKVREMIEGRLKSMREKVKSIGQGCGKGMAAMHFGKRPHRPHFRQGMHHHGHQGHHNRHGFINKVARFLLNIVIPILVGILAGMLTYLVGMLVGTGVALLWVRFRGRRQQYAAIALEDEDEEEGRIVLEKEDFMDESFVEAPPVYVEVEGKEIPRE